MRTGGFANSGASFAMSLLVAVTPLLMVLWSVTVKGFKAVVSTVWWTHSQAGMTAFVTGGGAYHALVGTVLSTTSLFGIYRFMAT